MKAIRILGRSIRDSFKSVFRNFALSLASISCIVITLIVVSISIILTYNVNNFATLVEKDVTIVVFLDTDVTDDEIRDIEEDINKLSNIETCTFQSKTEIASDMMESSSELKAILEQYTDETNPLQDTFKVKVTDIEKIKDVADAIKEMDKVSVVKYGEDMIEQLVSVFDIVKNVSIGMVIALILVTAFLISNTIKITIFSRRRQIEIMRLVGASNLNIRIPFIIEGFFLGALGSIIPIVATCYGYTALYDNFDGQLFSPFIKLIEPSPFIYQISLLLLVIGVMVGMIGSALAVRKHLKI
ncbi:MAG: permease-like cell division protein FtsX [Bacilli bacterium]|nr:permease-like cell division protein FtsX [Bacilli bacterium]